MKGDFETWHRYGISATNSIPKFKVKKTHFWYVFGVTAIEVKQQFLKQMDNANLFL
jgi:hypothetical protein